LSHFECSEGSREWLRRLAASGYARCHAGSTRNAFRAIEDAVRGSRRGAVDARGGYRLAASGLAAGVQAPAPDRPAPPHAEPAPSSPPPPPREDNPGLLNEMGKLFEKSLSIMPSMKAQARHSTI
jgi:hypothetical protein